MPEKTDNDSGWLLNQADGFDQDWMQRKFQDEDQ
jgi:hypothetical protein